MTVLSARDGYALWAPRYEQETVASHLENETVASLGVPTEGRALLDAGCGTARRFRDANAARGLGIDLSLEMISAAHVRGVLAVGDVRALPVGSGLFDVVWCRLVIGHLRDLGTVYRELARVCRVGGSVVVSDFAQEAIVAGHRRTFVDAHGQTRELEHFVHDDTDHDGAASAAGLAVVRRVRGYVGPTVRRYYESAGRLAAYREQVGMPLVSAFLLQASGPTDA